MKDTSKLQDILFSIVHNSREELKKIKWEDLNILQKLVHVHENSFKKGQKKCFQSGRQQRKISFLDEPCTEGSLNDRGGKVIFDFFTQEIDSKVKNGTRKSPNEKYEARKPGHKADKSVSSTQCRTRMLTRSVSKTGKRTLPSSPSYNTKRFDLNRISSKRRKLPQPPEERTYQKYTCTKGKTREQDENERKTIDDGQKNKCSSTTIRRPLKNIHAQDGFVRPSAWASVKPQIVKQGDDIQFCIPSKLSPVGNWQKMFHRSNTISLKNENTEYERNRLLSFRTFFRREFENYNTRGHNVAHRSQGIGSATDELETYLANRKLQRACHDIL